MASRSASLRDAHSGLRSTPGETALTRIGASSTASARQPVHGAADAGAERPAGAGSGCRGATGQRDGTVFRDARCERADHSDRTDVAGLEEAADAVRCQVGQRDQLQRFAGGEGQVVDGSDRVDECRDGGLIAQVDGAALGADWQARQRAVDAALPSRNDDWGGAAPCDRRRDGQADAGGASDNEYPLVFECHDFTINATAGDVQDPFSPHSDTLRV